MNLADYLKAHTTITVIIIILIVLAIFSELIKAFKKNSYHYKKREYFLTKHELGFYQRLCEATRNKNLIIFSKVRLADIIEPKSHNSTWQTQFNKIQSKHVDFLLCDKQYVQPKLIIELDDRSHDRKDRKERDAFVDKALSQAGIPILHVRNSEGLKGKIEAAIFS
jgi:hypothetical protein